MSTLFDKDEIKRNVDDFFSLYDVTKARIRDMCTAKKIHTNAVAANCVFIAEHLGLNEYDRDLAWTVGELHDFARFGQAVVTQTFRDNDRYNHAKFGARLLFKHGMIEDIMSDFDKVSDADKLVMERAVYHHSDFKLPDDLTERERLFCDIIREADQIDIFRTIATSTWEMIYGHGRDEVLSTDISDAILSAFPRHELADYSKRVTLADCHLAHIALCFGLKTAAARRRAIEQGYLQQLMNIEFSNPQVQQKYLAAKRCVEEFLQL